MKSSEEEELAGSFSYLVSNSLEDRTGRDNISWRFEDLSMEIDISIIFYRDVTRLIIHYELAKWNSSVPYMSHSKMQ